MFRIRYVEGVVPGPWRGRVSWVADGDTVRAGKEGGRRWIRLWGIDAPEHGQSMFLEAKAALIALVWHVDLVFEPVSLDRYRRLVCRVRTAAGVDVSRAMLDVGLAWWERKFAGGDSDLAAAESAARAGKVGIWSQRYVGYAPWVYRRRARIGA